MTCRTQTSKDKSYMVYIMEETPFTKYYYIKNICLDPLNITEELLYFFCLKYATGSAQSHLEYIVPEFTKFSNNFLRSQLLGKIFID